MNFKIASLTPTQKHILIDKGTESAFSGKFIESKEATKGRYLCRNCGLVLFRETDQFTSGCGWPSFDDEIEGTIKEQTDTDGRRCEIVCARCDGHMGHVFRGEGATSKSLRHCVNSVSIEFVNDQTVLDTEEIILAAGCFWGVEHLMKQLDGVLIAESGYIGGNENNPTYEAVCAKKTGHLEAVRVVFDVAKINLEAILKFFFEIHDFAQTNGQGPDLGPQYLSGIFVFSDEQKVVAENVISILTEMGHDVATRIYPMSTFWIAEDYHQDYYAQKGTEPYCHMRQQIF